MLLAAHDRGSSTCLATSTSRSPWIASLGNFQDPVDLSYLVTHSYSDVAKAQSTKSFIKYVVLDSVKVARQYRNVYLGPGRLARRQSQSGAPFQQAADDQVERNLGSNGESECVICSFPCRS